MELKIHTTYRWNVKKMIKAGLKCSFMAHNTINNFFKTNWKD